MQIYVRMVSAILLGLELGTRFQGVENVLLVLLKYPLTANILHAFYTGHDIRLLSCTQEFMIYSIPRFGKSLKGQYIGNKSVLVFNWFLIVLHELT